ncbi:hypothetical protein HanIR_Chr14g0707681 [Helianthus annuus]|nr:hypothetical protein HanIR_Chr14g0707681 [Helianthus annuus]
MLVHWSRWCLCFLPHWSKVVCRFFVLLSLVPLDRSVVFYQFFVLLHWFRAVFVKSGKVHVVLVVFRLISYESCDLVLVVKL